MNKKCRIAVDISPLSRDVRGIGVFVRGFLSHFAKIAASSFEVVLIGASHELALEFPFSLESRQNLDSSWLVWFPWNHPTFPVPGKFLVTIHDVAPFVFPEGEGKLQKRYKKGARQAEKIVADSKFTQREIERFLGVPDSKVLVIPPGFDQDMREQAGEIESFSPPWPYLLAIGPAEPRKNFSRLIQAFSLMKQEGIPHKLVILGELPPWRKKFGPFVREFNNPLPELAETYGVEKDVFFPGFVPGFLISRWFQAASLVVIPSLYEGFGYPVLETYSWGIPLACSQAASLPEVAGSAAFYFDPLDVERMAQTLLQVLNSNVEIEEKKQEARCRLSCFSWETCVTRYASLFLKIGSKKGTLDS